MKKVFLLMQITLLMSFSTWAQTVVTIGNGAYGYNSEAPIDLISNYSASQTIYLASEITDTGYITAISYYNTATSLNTTRNIKVYMATTTISSFSWTDTLSSNDFTLVYEGPWNITSNEWSEITLATPFHYDGTQNLVIGFEDYTSSAEQITDYYGYWQSTNGSSQRMLKYSDNYSPVNVCPTNPLFKRYYPNTKITISPNDDFCAGITNAAVSNVTILSATITWADREDSPTYYYQVKSSSASWVDNADMQTTDTSILLTDLQPNTTYNVRIKVDCGDIQSSYKNLTFTTACGLIATVPQTWDFEPEGNTSGTTSSPLPTCWQRIYTGTTSTYNNQEYPYCFSSTTYSHQGNYMLYWTYGANRSIAILPQIDTNILPLNTLQLSFYARQGYSDAQLQVGLMTDATDTNTFITFTTIPLTSTYTLYEVPLTSFTGSGSYIAFRSVSSAAIYVDDLTLHTAPPCTRPNEILCNTTTNSSTITWNSTATDFVVYYRPTTDTTAYQSVNDFTSTDTANMYTIVLDDLESATNYTYHIVALCEGDSIASIEHIFTTQCVAYDTLPVSWDFETYHPQTNLPVCWAKTSNGASVGAYTSTSYHVSGLRSLYMTGLTNITILPDFDWSVLNLNDLQLRFQAKSSSTSGVTIQVGMMSNVNDTSTFEPVANIPLNSTFEQVVAMFPAYTGSGTHLALRLRGGSYPTAYIDDMILETMPACPKVQSITATNITTDSLYLTWVGNNESYLVRYKTSEDSVWSTDNVLTDTSSAILYNLQANTEYIVEVAPDCEDITDSMYNRATFTTACDMITSVPITWTFETGNSSGTISYPLPACWQRAVSNSYPYVYQSYYSANEGTYLLKFYNKGNIGILPQIDITTLPINNLQLSLYAKGESSYSTSVLQVGVMTDVTDTSTFVPVSTITLSGSAYALYEIPLNTYTGTGSYIALKNASSSFYTELYVDDVLLDVIPTCTRPSDINISATSNQATVRWTSTGDDFAIYYKENSATVYDSIITFVATDTTDVFVATITNLNPATTYNVYVKANCGETSLVSNADTFTTQCAVLNVPYTVDFENVNIWGRPICWSFVNSVTNSSYTYPLVNSSTFRGHNSSKGLEFHSTENVNNAAIAVMPEFSVNLNQLSVEFFSRPEVWVTTHHNSGRLDVGYMTDPTDATSFVLLDSISTYNLTDSAYHRYIVNFDTIGVTSGYIAFRHVPNASNFYWYIDDITVDYVSDCSQATNLIANNITSNSAELSWNLSQTNVTLSYKTSTDTLFTNIDNVTLDDNGVYTLSGLQSNTTYQWKVSYVCSGDNEVYSSDVMNFTTMCSMIDDVPMVWDFETGNTSGTTSYPLPTCWQRQYGDYPYTNLYAVAHSGNHTLYFSQKGNLVMLPQIDINTLPINTLQLSMYAKIYSSASSSTYNTILQVGVMTDPTNPATFTAIDSVVLTDEYLFYEFPLTSYNAQGSYIALKNVSTYTYASFYVDDLTLDVIPACTRPTDIHITTLDDSATIGWSSTGSNFEVYYKKVTDSTYLGPITNFTADSLENRWSCTINSLDYSTAYEIYIKTLCSDTSMVSSVVSFYSQCATITDFPYMENFESLSSEYFGCWTTQIVTGSNNWDIVSSQAGKVAHRPYTNGEAYLISPVMDIASLPLAKLSYKWEVCQDHNGNKDSLQVYYRTSAEGEWFLLATHTPSYTGNLSAAGYIPSQDTTIVLPNVSNAYQIAFLAKGRNGYGVYLDSVVVVDTQVACTPVRDTLINNICYGDTFFFNSQAYFESGVYTSTVTGVGEDCDTIYTIYLTVLPQNIVMDTVTVCYGDSVIFNGQTLTEGNNQILVEGFVGDCDTLYSITLNVRQANEPVNDTVVVSLNDLPYLYHGQLFEQLGDYTINEEDVNGCLQTYNLVLIHNASLIDMENILQLSLYPNPTSDNATLIVKGLFEQATVIITDQMAKVMYKQSIPKDTQSLVLKTSNLASGVYYVTIKTGAFTKTQKLIKD